MQLLLALVILALLYLFTQVRHLRKSVESLQRQLRELAREIPTRAFEDQTQEAASEPDLDLDPIGLEPEALAASHSPADSQSAVTTPPPQAAFAREQGAPSPQKHTATATSPVFFDRALTWLKRYFTEGNVIVRVGVIVLFFGVAFLLRYANQQGVLPVQLKLCSVAALGVALLAIGWRLRRMRVTYGLILQGGGLGILYITVFAALRLFHLIPPSISFALLVVMVILSAALAVLQNARSLAVMAVTGGFLAPILSASGQGDHVTLFSYYALLNAGIVAIAWFKAWRILNLLGFVFTFVIASLWGVLNYTPANLPSAQFFLVLFFLFYVSIAIFFARRQPPNLTGYVDASLVFGVPLVGFGLQAGIVYQYQYGLAWAAFALGVFYSLLLILCRRFGGATYRLLAEAYLALAAVFLSLAIPFALDGEWVASVWALEGAGVLWVSLRQRRQLGAAFALALQVLAGVYFLAAQWHRDGEAFLVNSVFLGGVLLALSNGVSSYLLRHSSPDILRVIRRCSQPLLLLALTWWFLNGAQEALANIAPMYVYVAMLLFVATSCMVLGFLELKLQWSELRFTGFGLLLFMLLAAGWALQNLNHPGESWGYAGWLALFCVLSWLLYLRDRRPLAAVNAVGLHLLGWLLFAVLGTTELVWFVVDTLNLADSWECLALVPVSLLLTWCVLKLNVWPWTDHYASYLIYGSSPLVAFMALWSVAISATSAGSFLPLQYVPLLNPLDLTQLAVFFTGFYWWRKVCSVGVIKVSRSHGWAVIAALVFVWCNAMLLRSLHHWSGVSYELNAIVNSALAQAALTIFWALLGLSVMFIATRKHWRNTWLVAAVLLAVVVAKLFLMDMRDSNTLEAIVSFIAVGILLLVVGYFSPLPPKAKVPLAE
ncbi:DUF2339 domain-containing protein [uncultured Gilvimarinus sp.]|uniref:DUF2339 domain-containing protein n=1 Tax=uncultured Gilvimarinus sp. TaxID=1689143 RepID=UPI0030DA4BFB